MQGEGVKGRKKMERSIYVEEKKGLNTYIVLVISFLPYASPSTNTKHAHGGKVVSFGENVLSQSTLYVE